MARVPQISINVAQLHQIGQYHLPTLANLHLDAAQELDSVPYLRPQLFLTPASGESNMKSVAYPKWLELYSILQSVMQTTVTNLTDTGDGCVNAAAAFYDNELSNAERLGVDAEMEEWVNGTDGEPGFGPPPPHPEDPPAPNEIPDDNAIYTNDDRGGVDDADLVNLPDAPEEGK